MTFEPECDSQDSHDHPETHSTEPLGCTPPLIRNSAPDARASIGQSTGGVEWSGRATALDAATGRSEGIGGHRRHGAVYWRPRTSEDDMEQPVGVHRLLLLRFAPGQSRAPQSVKSLYDTQKQQSPALRAGLSC